MSTSPVPPTSRPDRLTWRNYVTVLPAGADRIGLRRFHLLLFLVVGLIGLRPLLPAVVPSADGGCARGFVPPQASPPPEMALAEVIVADNSAATLDRPTVVPVTAAATLPSPQPTVPLTSAAFPVPAVPHAMPEAPGSPSPAPVATAPASVATAGVFPWPREYPRQAREQRLEGTVMLAVRVNREGHPVSVTVKDSSGHAVLDRFARRWVSDHWRWPAGDERSYLVRSSFVCGDDANGKSHSPCPGRTLRETTARLCGRMKMFQSN